MLSCSLSLRLEFNALFITLALLCARDTGVCQAQNGGCGQCGKKEKIPSHDVGTRGHSGPQKPARLVLLGLLGLSVSYCSS